MQNVDKLVDYTLAT